VKARSLLPRGQRVRLEASFHPSLSSARTDKDARPIVERIGESRARHVPPARRPTSRRGGPTPGCRRPGGSKNNSSPPSSRAHATCPVDVDRRPRAMANKANLSSLRQCRFTASHAALRDTGSVHIPRPVYGLASRKRLPPRFQKPAPSRAEHSGCVPVPTSTRLPLRGQCRLCSSSSAPASRFISKYGCPSKHLRTLLTFWSATVLYESRPPRAMLQEAKQRRGRGNLLDMNRLRAGAGATLPQSHGPELALPQEARAGRRRDVVGLQ